MPQTLVKPSYLAKTSVHFL